MYLLLTSESGARLGELRLWAKDGRVARLDDARVVTKLEDTLVLGELLAQLGQREESLIRVRRAVLLVH